MAIIVIVIINLFIFIKKKKKDKSGDNAVNVLFLKCLVFYLSLVPGE